ncbi:MAG: hypothetical protein U0T02_12215 [Solirubrobacteraceae bacterium]
MKPVDLFSRDVHTFWATTYQFDLKLFDQFLLRRLGHQPLNAVVLADEGNLTDTLAGLGEVDVHVANSANRRYLLRGAQTASGGRFHPKTYFVSSRRRTLLLIGSGNLTRPGLDRGREVFCTYDATNEDHVGVIHTWASWIGELVSARHDGQLHRRYDHLRTIMSGLSGARSSAEFRTNASEPLIVALETAVSSGVRELHVSAPYFDEHAQALGKLIGRLAPSRSLHLYLGARTNVNGGSLRRVLEAAECDVIVRRFEPEQFVHAKLIGVIGDDGAGMLLCGSPNLSRAALTSTYTNPGSYGNCEVAVLRRGSPSDVRAAFRPPATTLELSDLDAVEAIGYEADASSTHAFPVRLLSIEMSPDGHLRAFSDAAAIDQLAVAWEGQNEPMALTGDGRTVDPLGEGNLRPIVWLVDAVGEICSNRVVVDDPTALEEMLGERGGAADRPAEIADEDGRSDLVALLSWAHQHFVFDLDDTPAVRRANNAQEQQHDQDDTDFWERYVRDELTYDTRSQTYRPLSGGHTLASVDLLLREIEAMFNAAPHERRLRIVRGETSTHPGEPTGHMWSFSARQRLRARNLIRRWSRALADPRHAWVASDAPAVNYTALIELLTLIWLGEALDDGVMPDLLEEVWSALLGAAGRKGLLDVADNELRATVLADISDDTRQLAAGLAYVALHSEMPWTEYVYDWQPFLKRGREARLFGPGPLSADLAEALLDEGRPTPLEIEDLLTHRAEWVDDATWGKRIARELGLRTVALVPHAGYKDVEVVVSIEGMANAGRDSRTVVLARRVMSFKRSNHVLIVAGTERILLRLGEYANALIDGQQRKSVQVIDGERLRAVESQGGSLAELLGLAA